MSNNVFYQANTLASPPSTTIVETIDEGSGVERQVICIGSIGHAGTEVQTPIAVPTYIVSNPSNITLGAGVPADVTAANIDGLSPGNVLETINFHYNLNSTGTYDRLRNNFDQGPIQVASGTGAGTYQSGVQTNYNWRGALFLINVIAITAGTTLTVTINWVNQGTLVPLISTAALGATGITMLTLYPGAPTTANVSLNSPLPARWSSTAVIAGAGTVSANIASATLIL